MKYVIAIIACSTMLFACNKNKDCALGFIGDNCDIQETPQSITLNSTDISNFPATKADGAGWDLSDGPDIYFKIMLGGAVIYTSETKNDVLPGSELVFTDGTPFNFENVTDNYTVTFFDDDGILGSDEMGSFSINLYSSNNNFPNVITYTNPGGSSFVFSFHVDYNH